MDRIYIPPHIRKNQNDDEHEPSTTTTTTEEAISPPPPPLQGSRSRDDIVIVGLPGGTSRSRGRPGMHRESSKGLIALHPPPSHSLPQTTTATNALGSIPQVAAEVWDNHDQQQLEYDDTDAPPSVDSAEEKDGHWSPRERRLFWFAVVNLCVAALLLGILLGSINEEEDSEESKDDDDVQVPLSETLMGRVLESITMAPLLYGHEEHPTITIPNSTVYTDERDRALWVKKDDVCYAMFRGTAAELDDWSTNVNTRPVRVFQASSSSQEEGKEVVCTTTVGFYNAYHAKNYTDTFRNEVRECVASCRRGGSGSSSRSSNDPPCELVVAGASQGGAIASIAAIDLADLHPTLITFGQPPTLFDIGYGPCEAIDTAHYFRFVNTAAWTGTGLRYDPVVVATMPHMPQGSVDKLGNLILLSDSEGGVVRYPSNVREDVGSGKSAGFETHKSVNYITRISALIENGIFPVPEDGWVDGSLCNYDSECQSSQCDNTTIFASRCEGP